MQRHNGHFAGRRPFQGSQGIFYGRLALDSAKKDIFPFKLGEHQGVQGEIFPGACRRRAAVAHQQNGIVFIIRRKILGQGVQ